MGILNDLRIALFDFRSYPKLLKNPKKRVFAFIVLVTGIFWLMTSVVPAAAFFARTGGFTRLVETYVPEFTLKDGKLLGIIAVADVMKSDSPNTTGTCLPLALV